jgi:hypothetical protein
MTSITPASTVRRLLARPADEGGHEGRCSTDLCTWFVSVEDHDEVHAAFNLHRCADHLRTQITVITFGWGHPEGAPEADQLVDLREYRDPHIKPDFRYLTGRDQIVRDTVLATPGVRGLIAKAVAKARKDKIPGKPYVIATGCMGGRHRGYVAGEEIATALGAVLIHRDVDKPVLARKTDTAPEPEAGESANETPVRRTTTRHCSPPVSCDCDYVCEQAGAV